MGDNPYAAYPARPAEVAAWEELLVRLELAPRALRNTLEETAADSDLNTAIRPRLASLVAREMAAAEALQRLRQRTVLQRSGGRAAETGERPVAEYLARFAELRGRNFAAVQRRGLEVWDWAARHPDHGTVTAFQLLSRLVHEDGRVLAEIRHTLHATPRC